MDHLCALHGKTSFRCLFYQCTSTSNNLVASLYLLASESLSHYLQVIVSSSFWCLPLIAIFAERFEMFVSLRVVKIREILSEGGTWASSSQEHRYAVILSTSRSSSISHRRFVMAWKGQSIFDENEKSPSQTVGSGRGRREPEV